MKAVYIFACLIAALATAAADTYVGPPVPSCSSSPDLIITVTSLGKAANRVRVDVYREIENGERAFWTGFTASDGTAKPSALSPGEYRVFADAGDRTGMMSLLVGQFEGTTRCNLKIGPPNSVEAGEQTPEEPSNLQLKEFRGVVVDDKKVPIPHVIVRVLRSGSSRGYLAQFQSDENGRFELHLGEGVYVGTFAYQGFRLRMVLFRLSNEGWQGFELGLTPDGSPAHDPPGAEWSSGPVTDNHGRIGIERARRSASRGRVENIALSSRAKRIAHAILAVEGPCVLLGVFAEETEGPSTRHPISFADRMAWSG